jgi:hypothetical protein
MRAANCATSPSVDSTKLELGTKMPVIKIVPQTPAPATITRQTFPFEIRPAWLPGAARMRKANSARAVFGVLHDGVTQQTLTAADLQDTFFSSISDLISYREGWHCGRYWSVEAWQKARTNNGVTNIDILAEHVLPRGIALRHALTLNRTDAADFVWEQSFYCMITKEEDARLNAAGLQAEGWPEEPWKRYAHERLGVVGIQVLDAEDPAGNKLIPSSVRIRLQALGILASWQFGYGVPVAHAGMPVAAAGAFFPLSGTP